MIAMGGTLWTARAPKKVAVSGPWKTGKMTKGDFPLSKNSSFRLGTGWEYCIHELSGPNRMRLLIAFHVGKRDYLAWLTIENDHDQMIIARLEYHASHLGWHVHLKPDDLAKVAWGVVKQPGERLVDCKSDFDPAIDKNDAEAVAFRVFNVQPETWGMA